MHVMCMSVKGVKFENNKKSFLQFTRFFCKYEVSLRAMEPASIACQHRNEVFVENHENSCIRLACEPHRSRLEAGGELGGDRRVIFALAACFRMKCHAP